MQESCRILEDMDAFEYTLYVTKYRFASIAPTTILIMPTFRHFADSRSPNSHE